MQMAGDAACLARTLESLDEWTIVAMRGSEEHAEEDLALMARTLRRTKSLQGRGAAADVADMSQSADAVAILMQVVGQMQVPTALPSGPCSAGGPATLVKGLWNSGLHSPFNSARFRQNCTNGNMAGQRPGRAQPHGRRCRVVLDACMLLGDAYGACFQAEADAALVLSLRRGNRLDKAAGSAAGSAGHVCIQGARADGHEYRQGRRHVPLVPRGAPQ